MIDIVAHKMEYCGDLIDQAVELTQYTDEYYTVYKEVYETCFREMRTALELTPVDCCDSREVLMQKQSEIFLLIKNEELIASVAIFDNEIDDLIVEKQYQCKGYGELVLKFALHYMQERKLTPIILNVADWNKGAINLYLKNGFKIIETETIKRSN